jgi:hypothetical protein
LDILVVAEVICGVGTGVSLRKCGNVAGSLEGDADQLPPTKRRVLRQKQVRLRDEYTRGESSDDLLERDTI